MRDCEINLPGLKIIRAFKLNYVGTPNFGTFNGEINPASARAAKATWWFMVDACRLLHQLVGPTRFRQMEGKGDSFPFQISGFLYWER